MSTKKVTEIGRKIVNQAPPASGVRGQLPIPPAGKVVKVQHLTPSERELLDKYGVSGDELPENLAEIIAAAEAQATDLDRMPPPLPMDTPPVKQPEILDVDKLPPEKRERYNNIIKSSVEQAREYAQIEKANANRDPSVNEAIRTALSDKQVVIEDDRDKVKEKNKVTKDKKADEFCPRCGHDLTSNELVEVSDADKLLFIESVLSGKPMFKTYKLLGGNMLLTVRSLTIEEADAVMLQVYIDGNNDRVVTYYDRVETLNKYRTCLQVAKIDFPTEEISLPKHMSEWDVDAEGKADTAVYYIWEKFRKMVDKSDALHRIMVASVAEFNQLQLTLETRAADPNFWKATGRQSS